MKDWVFFTIFGAIIIITIIIIIKKMSNENEEPELYGEDRSGKIVEYNKITVPTKNYSIMDARDSLEYARTKYGKEFAQLMERIWRLESGHFQSNQFKHTGTAGMEFGKWGKWVLNYLTSPIDLLEYRDPVRGKKWFLVFDNLSKYMDLMHYYIYTVRGGNWAAWNSLNEDSQKKYRSAVNRVSNTLII